MSSGAAKRGNCQDENKDARLRVIADQERFRIATSWVDLRSPVIFRLALKRRHPPKRAVFQLHVCTTVCYSRNARVTHHNLASQKLLVILKRYKPRLEVELDGGRSRRHAKWIRVHHHHFQIFFHPATRSNVKDETIVRDETAVKIN